MGGGDQSEAHSALIHVDAHLILITKMQFPASHCRLMGNLLSKCFFAQCHATSRMDGLHADRPEPQAYLINRCVYDKLVVWKHIQQTGMEMTKTIIYLLMFGLFYWFGLTYKQDLRK